MKYEMKYTFSGKIRLNLSSNRVCLELALVICFHIEINEGL